MEASRRPELAEQETRSRTELVERQRPLELATAALARARAGRGSVLAVEGPNGTGKSTLLAAVREASVDRMAVCYGASRELEQEFPFGVVLQLFESKLTDAWEDARTRLLAGGASAAMPLFASDRPPSEASFPLLHGLYRLCAHLAQLGGLAILVDDLDLADRASLRFLLYLTERIEELPVALVLTSGSAIRRPDRDLLEEVMGHRATTRYGLRPLSGRGTAQHLRGAWFADAGEDFCIAVHRATRGNPYLVRELANALRQMNVEPDGAGARQVAEVAPASVAAAALRRASVVGDGSPALIRAVAILGDGAELRHAAKLAGVPADRALGLARGLVGAGLLVDEERLSFVHPVVRAAVVANQRPAERMAVHLRTARLLAKEQAPAERVAGHLMRATRTGDDDAVETLCEAAATALARGVPESAVRYLRRAMEEPPSSKLRAHVVLELGRAEASAGEPEAAPRLDQAIKRVQGRRLRARSALEGARTSARHPNAAAALQHGIDDIGDDGELGGRLLAAYATVSRLHPRAARVPAEPAAPPAGNDTAADRALLALLAMEAASRGDPRERVVELAERALARGALLDDEAANRSTYCLAAHALALAEDLQTAEVALTAAVQDAQSRGSVLGFATASYFRSLAIMRRGRMADAAADARQAIAAERHGWRLAVPAARALLAETLLERGELDAARKQLDMAERSAPETEPAVLGLLAVRGSVHLREGQAKAALADFLACRDYLEAIGAGNPALVAWRSGAARANALLGDSGEAIRLASEELAAAEAFGAPGQIGRALRVLGAVGEGAAALEALEAAVARLERSHAALERGRALVDFGAALRRSGHQRAAREPLRRGLDLAQRCGATALAGMALRETHAAGGRPRRTALQGIDSLTPRERQVASLAARGLSNREIAETLVVTVKTVEWHLNHSFEKLDVRSRSSLRDLLPNEAD